MRRIAAMALLLTLALAAAAAPAAAAAAARVNITEIEGEVMCPVCGTLLELAESPQAEREKAFVARLIAAGRTKAEIKDALVAQYGRAVLALPESKGFDLSAYAVPVIAFVLAAIALALGVRRWRRDGGGDGEQPPRAPRGEDADRLDADIARYDL
jgi:cytochrome c-type biogenesis protein CcmH